MTPYGRFWVTPEGRKANEGCSYSVVQHLHSFIREIFEMALADRKVQVNPALGLVIPRCKQSKARSTLDPSEVQRVEQSLDIRERLFFRLACTGGGMRPSEVAGLRLGDIGNDRIHMNRRIYRGKVSEEGELKSRRGRREVPIAPRTGALLKEYLKLLVDDRPDAWVFPSENPQRALV